MEPPQSLGSSGRPVRQGPGKVAARTCLSLQPGSHLDQRGRVRGTTTWGIAQMRTNRHFAGPWVQEGRALIETTLLWLLLMRC